MAMFVGGYSACRRPCRWSSVPPSSPLPLHVAMVACEQERQICIATRRSRGMIFGNNTTGRFSGSAARRGSQLGSRAASISSSTSVSGNVESNEPDAKIIDGKKMAAQVQEELAAEVKQMQESDGMVPGLAVIIVGERKDSQTYVRAKRKACEKVGIASFGYDLPEDTSQQSLEKLIDELNQRPDVHGILVQLPLPKHIDSEVVLDKISYEKDVDGFHPLNMGRLCMAGGGREEPRFVPCTPKGCIEMLKRKKVAVAGKTAVVLGRSNIVGLPAAMLLNQMDATVTICHSKTQDLASKVREADILVAAIGKACFVPGDWIKPGAIVIDVGINAVEDASKKSGYRLVGDVDFASCYEKASLITPVPGGVGPMTIAMLLRNTVDGAARTLENKK